jgi:tRNA nucleotidyltransferase (CCA-adding enzyme)
MGADSVLKNVLRKITPTKRQEDEIKRITEKVTRVTKQILKPMGLSYTLAGSYIRNTYMLDKKEFDIFILFPEPTEREELEKKGLDTGKKIVRKLKGNHKIAYAEHPYVRAVIDGYDVDIVPCYKLKSAEKIKSAVDRTPFHNKWMSSHLKPNQSDEVRLLKQFLKGIGIYGSDAKTEGFSGYLCELLIIRYGSFKKLVKQAARWNAGQTIIDLEKHHSEKEKLKKKFRREPLIVIDPVDPNRNVASVLSPANFTKFRAACRGFLERPSEKFFFPKKSAKSAGLKKTIEKRGTKFIAVRFKRPDVIDDILYPQLRKTAKRVANILEGREFRVMGFDVWAGKDCIILLEMEVWRLPKIRKLVGPSIFSKKHSDEFLKKYRNKGRIWVENDYYVAEVEREFLTAEDKLKDSLSKKAKILKAKGIAGYVAEALSKGFRLLDEKGILKLAEREEGFGVFLDEYMRREFY